MATLAEQPAGIGPRPDLLTGTPRAHALDRWIYFITAASFVAIVLAGFIPDSLDKIAAVESGRRPPFPLVLHAHAVLMGSFLALLLAQTWLVATGRCALHMKLGLASLVIAPALVAVGLALVPTMYFETWNAMQAAPPEGRAQLATVVGIKENIMLLQLRIGILFPLFLGIALWARGRHSGLHKRMMILATAGTLPAGIDRIPWLVHTMPDSPLSPDLYTLLAISPMLLWDIFRNRRLHEAYWIWLGISLPFALAVHGWWDTPWWHETARRLMGV
jgi:hypothetical protein